MGQAELGQAGLERLADWQLTEPGGGWVQATRGAQQKGQAPQLQQVEQRWAELEQLPHGQQGESGGGWVQATWSAGLHSCRVLSWRGRRSRGRGCRLIMLPWNRLTQSVMTVHLRSCSPLRWMLPL